MSAAGDSRNGSPGRVIALACAGAAIVTSGVQGIAPAIPAIQEQFALSAAQVALITSAYLFPSMFSALAAGVLADRFGARPVFAGSLLLYGIGAVVLLVTDSLALLLVVRGVQGAAFGAVLSLSVAIIGHVVPTGPAAARGQGRRIIWMAVAEGAFPVAGGLLLLISWSAPFLLGLLALPVAVLVWFLMPQMRTPRKMSRKESAGVVLRAPALAGVQILGALRFIFKYAMLTYFPLLAVNEHGMSPALVGVGLGVSSLIAAVAAGLSERLAYRWSSSQLIGASLLATTVSGLGLGLAENPVLLLAALFVFGVQDGVFGVAHNVLVTEMAPAPVRSTYIGLTGTVRNVGKFVAPMLFGASTLLFSLPHSFLVLAGVGLASMVVTRRVGRAQAELGREGDPPPSLEHGGR